MVASGEPREIRDRLKEVYHDLPEAMRRIADTLMSDPLLGALWGIESMAERANVSIGTVVRFSKRLGYRGFSEFRDALRDACQIRSGGDPLEALEAPADPFWALGEVVRRDRENLSRLVQTLDHSTLDSATQLLTRARHRVLLGRGVSNLMCQVLAFNLTQAGLPCIAASPSDFSNQVANLGAGDLLGLLLVLKSGRIAHAAPEIYRVLGPGQDYLDFLKPDTGGADGRTVLSRALAAPALADLQRVAGIERGPRHGAHPQDADDPDECGHHCVSGQLASRHPGDFPTPSSYPLCTKQAWRRPRKVAR